VSKHTPTPWRQQGEPNGHRINGEGGPVAVASPRFMDRTERLANAAFIVRACNAHEDLLAACKKLLGLVRERPENLASYGAHYTVQDAEAAIAKAEAAP
jgi:hypothetical protein